MEKSKKTEPIPAPGRRIAYRFEHDLTETELAEARRKAKLAGISLEAWLRAAAEAESQAKETGDR